MAMLVPLYTRKTRGPNAALEAFYVVPSMTGLFQLENWEP